MPQPTLQIGDLPRVNEISLVLARNGFGHLLDRVGLTAPPAAAQAEVPSGSFARRLRLVLVELGPTFVKLGQVLALRPDILPQDVLAEFETLHDRVPAMDVDDVRALVEQEIGAAVATVFQHIDPEPLGAASIAQVHRAVLLDGTEVAVKIQRRGIERRIRGDIHILYALAQLIEGRLAVPGLMTPSAIVREFDVAISRELDFTEEARNAEHMGRVLAGLHGVKVPRVYPERSTRRMLVLQRIHGRPLREVLPTLDREQASTLAHTIMEATWRQTFESGLFHGDPHPGNLFVDEDGQLVYLDFGLVGQLTRGMQDTLVEVFTSMVFRDAEALAMAVYRAGAANGRIDMRAFVAELERKMVQYHGASLDQLASPTTFVDVVQLCTRFQIALPPEYAILSRAITLVEGEVRALMPDVDIVAEVKPYAQRLVQRRLEPDRVAQDLTRLALQAQGALRDVPTQFTQFLMDLEAGRITVVTRDPDAKAMREEIRAAVLRLSLAFLASTVTLGSLLLLAAWSPAPYEVPVFGLGAVLALGLGLGLFGALGLHVFFAGFLDLSAWRRRFMTLLRFFSWRRT